MIKCIVLKLNWSHRSTSSITVHNTAKQSTVIDTTQQRTKWILSYNTCFDNITTYHWWHNTLFDITLYFINDTHITVFILHDNVEHNMAPEQRHRGRRWSLMKYEMTKVLKEQVPEIVVATPGRLIDLIQMKATNLRRCTMVVLDEVRHPNYSLTHSTSYSTPLLVEGRQNVRNGIRVPDSFYSE